MYVLLLYLYLYIHIYIYIYIHWFPIYFALFWLALVSAKCLGKPLPKRRQEYGRQDIKFTGIFEEGWSSSVTYIAQAEVWDAQWSTDTLDWGGDTWIKSENPRSSQVWTKSAKHDLDIPVLATRAV